MSSLFDCMMMLALFAWFTYNFMYVEENLKLDDHMLITIALPAVMALWAFLSNSTKRKSK